MFEKLSSRKLWAAVISATLVALGGQLEISPDNVQAIVTIAVGYIIGQGGVDAAKEFKKKD